MPAEVELRAYLTLAFTPHLGAISFLKLLQQFQLPSRVLSLPYEQVQSFIEKPKLVAPHWRNPKIELELVGPALDWLDPVQKRYIITLLDDNYPLELSQIYSPPPVLFMRGNLSLLSKQKVAVVGSRSPTPQGRTIATQTARELSQYNYCVVSGMASGIDTAAHQGSLLDSGSTIAVLGTGIDLVYPRANHALAHQIAEGGLLISEFPLGTKANSIHFPIRNRVIAGLSLGTVVVEATIKSGSLITARLAMEYGREVMAFPGSIFNPQSKGTHYLIREGAKLVETTREIIEEFGKSDYNGSMLNTEAQSSTKLQVDSLTKRVLEAMDSRLIHPDEISQLLQLETEKVYSMLICLELEGVVQRTSGGRFQRVIF
ncbi:MAG: DNA-processing protein DprA [Neisseriaceae bacterium]